MRSRSAIAILLGVLLLLGAVHFTAPSPSEKCDRAGGTWDDGAGGSATCIADTQEKCLARGGAWFRDGLGDHLTCVVPTKDGGKVCSDASECERGCVYHGPYPVPSGPVTGRCAPNDGLSGCRTFVARGQLGSRVCE